MPQIITNSGERKLLERALKGPSPALKLGLFGNNATISPTVLKTAFTAPTFAGYADHDLPANGWAAAATNTDGQGDISHAQKSWNYTGATNQLIYGYYVYDPADNAVLWANKFDTPRQVVDAGGIDITPRLLAYDPADA